MSEAEVVASTPGLPLTRRRAVEELRALGITPGTTMLVHTSLRSLGWVVGGAETVVLALEEAVGPTGTVVMPAFSLSAPEPSRWVAPPVPEAWWATIRRDWPPFDVDLTPTRGIGVVPETFRRQRGTLRSVHPTTSFCARGPLAVELLREHSLDFGLGEGSPLARLYDRGAHVLLLGVDHSTNSSLHLAEYRSDWVGRDRRQEFAGRIVRGDREESVRFEDIEGTSDDFAELGREFESSTGAVTVGRVGAATARRMEQRPLVDYGVRWLAEHRPRAA